jgi:hypothetical protein
MQKKQLGKKNDLVCSVRLAVDAEPKYFDLQPTNWKVESRDNAESKPKLRGLCPGLLCEGRLRGSGSWAAALLTLEMILDLL